MIKEIFDIEPIQKNSLIIFICIACMAFSQIFIFEKDLVLNNAFATIGLSLALAIAWIIISLPSYFFFQNFINSKKKGKVYKSLFERLVLSFGFFTLAWMLLITYLSYELGWSFKNLIEYTIIVKISKTIFWFIAWHVRTKKDCVEANL